MMYFLAATLFLVPHLCQAKNIILFIADGMGPAVVGAARIYRHGAKGNLVMDKLPFTAFVKTYGSDKLVTDSAATATALATGVKTSYRSLSVRPDGEPVPTIAELAKKKGQSVGIVTNTRLTHATPAAFYGHFKNRKKEKKIGRALIQSNFDVFLGGGLKTVDYKLNRRFKLIQKKSEMKPHKGPVLGLFAVDHLQYMADRDEKSDQEPTLTEMVHFAIRQLRTNPKGYFLMVEGGRIDHALHEGRSKRALEEVLEFDRAIRKALNMVEAKDTTLIVTSDHDTAGLSINGYPSREADILKWETHYPAITYATGPKRSAYRMSMGAHTGVDVPLYAVGQYGSLFHGTLDNTEVFDIMLKVLKKP